MQSPPRRLAREREGGGGPVLLGRVEEFVGGGLQVRQVPLHLLDRVVLPKVDHSES